MPKFNGNETYVHRRRVDEDAAAIRERAKLELAKDIPAVPKVAPLQDDPAKFHAMVRRTERAMRKPGPGDRGLSNSRPPDAFRLAVSPESAARTLRFLNGLWVALEALGAETSKGDKLSEWFRIELEGEKITLYINETVRRHERPLTAEEKRKERDGTLHYISNRFLWEPTGKLNLSILSLHGVTLAKISDGRETLEERLPEIVDIFRRTAVEQRLTREAAEAEAKRRQEAERIREKKREVIDQHLRRLRKSEEYAMQFERAERLRRYASALEGAMNGQEDAEVLENLTFRSRWARKVADWLDPVVSAEWPEVDDGPAPHWWREYQERMGVDREWY